MEKGYNRHHVCWERRQWLRDRFSRRIREHSGMIIPLPIKIHRELHQEFAPIRPPSHDLSVIGEYNLRTTDETDPTIVIPRQADFLWQLAQNDNQIGHEALRYAQHLEQQIEFLNLRAI